MRPPAYIEDQPASEVPFSLPSRFLIHFGQLIKLKGSDLLARALLIAWEKAPDITMVWCGSGWEIESGARCGQLIGSRPLYRTAFKATVYAVLARAEAAVLPSQVDNLPNTVIESLLFGVPVVGSRGASIDELVEEGRTGYLVRVGDVVSLAEALVRVWQGLGAVTKGFKWTSAIREEMLPSKPSAGSCNWPRKRRLSEVSGDTVVR